MATIITSNIANKSKCFNLKMFKRPHEKSRNTQCQFSRFGIANDGLDKYKVAKKYRCHIGCISCD